MSFYNKQTTLVDHDGKVALIVFTRYCNFNCYGCHNMDFLRKGIGLVKCDEDDIIKSLHDPLYDMLIVSGGECTLNQDLEESLRYIKSHCSKPIRIDTNGTNFEFVKSLKDKRLVDGFAIDVKLAYWELPYGDKKNIEKFEIITGTKYDDVMIHNILRSMDVADDMPYTLFRTVKYPILQEEEVRDIKIYMSKHYKSKHSVNPFNATFLR